MSSPQKLLTPRQREYAFRAACGDTRHEIAVRFHVTSTAVGQALRRAGLDIADLRDVRCTYCGVLMRAAHATPRATLRDRIHTCPRPDCHRQYARDAQRRRRGSTGSTARLPEATVRAVLARKGQASERTVAREQGISRSAVNGLWRGVRRRELARGETEGSAPA